MIKIEKISSISASRYRKIMERCGEKISSQVFKTAAPVIEDIKKNGNKALVKYIKRYEKVSLKPRELLVTRSEIKRAYGNLPAGVLRNIKLMVKNVGVFYNNQLNNTSQGWNVVFSGGYKAGQVLRPLDSVGVYVPGGTACYPSTAVMGIVPARIAGVNKIVMATPAGKDGKVADVVLVAADIAGADVILKAGGMQAVGAMAVGTETVPSVEKVVGPGNIWVSAAKLYVMMKNYTSIEFIAGPSEVLIIADSSANPSYIARDLMAQAEHDTNASAILVTTSEAVAKRVKKSLESMVEASPRSKTIKASLGRYGAIIVVKDVKQAIEVANDYAPEHLQIMTGKPEKLMKLIKNAGSVFIGGYTPTVLGDYLSGTNHILPTGGGARNTSGVNLETYFKRYTFQKFNKKSLEAFRKPLKEMADIEGLTEHGLSVEERFKGRKN